MIVETEDDAPKRPRTVTHYNEQLTVFRYAVRRKRVTCGRIQQIQRRRVTRATSMHPWLSIRCIMRFIDFSPRLRSENRCLSHIPVCKWINKHLVVPDNYTLCSLSSECTVSQQPTLQFSLNSTFNDMNKKLSYCWETVRRESMPRIAEMDVEMTT